MMSCCVCNQQSESQLTLSADHLPGRAPMPQCSITRNAAHVRHVGTFGDSRCKVRSHARTNDRTRHAKHTLFSVYPPHTRPLSVNIDSCSTLDVLAMLDKLAMFRLWCQRLEGCVSLQIDGLMHDEITHAEPFATSTYAGMPPSRRCRACWPRGAASTQRSPRREIVSEGMPAAQPFSDKWPPWPCRL
jgi:hypothetical protein